jgi:uncharacterized protein (DUF1697 family)
MTMDAANASPERLAAMSIHLALLRGINVGGHRPVAMSDLRDFLTQLGFAEPRSLLQSGNLLFRGGGQDCAELERLLETEADRRLGLRTDFLVRTAKDWKAVIASNPLRDEAERSPSRFIVMLLKDAPDASRVEALQAAVAGEEIVRAGGKQLYIVYPAGIGVSRLTNSLIEKKLGTRGTARNWNTVLKLGALTEA